jgi:sterol desaturase/sphingolipid hydroxylase (fatty acid hydroxylase superfamily)
MTLLGMSEPVFRLVVFAGAFLLFSALEALAPRRVRSQTRLARWTTNAGLLVIATALVRLLAFAAPLLALTVASALAIELGWGLFNVLALPLWLEVVLAIILLDLAIWFQHYITHKVPLLWRLHRVHHADRDLDASSALRFHPVEIAFSAAYKLAAAFLIGPAILAAILFEVVLNASAIFNHANWAIPPRVDRVLRWIIVTPDMHRVHHSVNRYEHDTNFGFCLSIWDRIFRTYTSDPDGGQTGMTLGLSDQQSAKTDRLGWSLIFPLR